jgi:hypothetical protein
MTIVYEERLSDSPYIETVTRGRMTSAGSSVRPAECSWHMVFVRYNGTMQPLVVGALPSSGVVTYREGAELLWVKFKLGTFMPHLPVKNILDVETTLPTAAGQSFWLKSSVWQYPDYDNVETFVDRLVHDDVLVRDPVVNAVLQGQPQDVPSRTLRHRFLRTTGLTQSHIYQVERAQRAAALLRQGKSILDTVYEVGYFDQPHLTRSLKRWVGHTPAQLIRLSNPD